MSAAAVDAQDADTAVRTSAVVPQHIPGSSISLDVSRPCRARDYTCAASLVQSAREAGLCHLSARYTTAVGQRSRLVFVADADVVFVMNEALISRRRGKSQLTPISGLFISARSTLI